ncbi:MAG: sugar phosphate isomerase/epimerase [Planctomycetaceae bacterium]|nr:sugar phosphate isomerase/epimerase [Planctomycetaceae bacterium]
MQPSRRDFLLTGTCAVAGIYGLGTTAVQAAQPAQNAAPLELGLASYTFREFDRADCIAMAKRLKFKKMCFKSMHLEMDSTDEQCRQAAEECNKAGLDLYGCGVCYMNSDAEVINTFRYARAAGMRVIVGVPKHELLPLVEEKVKETGILVAIHNHGPGDRLYPAPDSVLEKVENLDKRIGVCMDVGHTVRLDIDPAQSIIECGERLLDIHLKDETEATEKGQTLVCGHGIIDFPAIIRALKRINYQGVISFEYEAEGKDPLPGLAESVGFIRGVIRTI